TTGWATGFRSCGWGRGGPTTPASWSARSMRWGRPWTWSTCPMRPRTRSTSAPCCSCGPTSTSRGEGTGRRRTRAGWRRWRPGTGVLLRKRYNRRMTTVPARDLRNDTSGVLRRALAGEGGRDLVLERLPDVSAVSVVTLAELRAGVLAASGTDIRARRLATLSLAEAVHVLPIDEAVAGAWAHLRVRLVEASRRVNVNELWIAATAVAH